MSLFHLGHISRSAAPRLGRVIFAFVCAALASFVLTSHGSLAGQREEFTCISQVDGKIPWNLQGSTRWSPKNIARLCMGVENVSARLDCFKNEVTQKGVYWETAISNCELNEINERLRSGWKPNQLAPKYVQLQALLVHKRTEKSNDEVYITGTSDSTSFRIPEVMQIKEKAQQISPFIESTDQIHDVYYSMEMSEDDSSLNIWNVCNVFRPATIMTLAVKEKDDVYVQKDRRKDDLIGFVTLPIAGVTPGRYVAELTGDGGNYSLVYNVAAKKESLPACKADPLRDPDLKNRSIGDSPCEKYCVTELLGDGLKKCTATADRACSNIATVALGCIGICEARGGPPR